MFIELAIICFEFVKFWGLLIVINYSYYLLFCNLNNSVDHSVPTDLDIFFLSSLTIWLLFMCFLLFFTNLTRQQIVGYTNSWLYLILLSGLIQIIMCSFWHNYSFSVLKFFYFNNSYCIEPISYVIRFWIVFFTTLTFIISENYILSNKYNVLEFSILLVIGCYMSQVLTSLTDIFAILIVFECLSFIIIGISVITFTKSSVEACIKYFIQNSIITSLSIFGIFWIYFICKTTNFVFLNIIFSYIDMENLILQKNFTIFFVFVWLISFFFKLGLFPTHFYVTDIYEVSPIPSILFLSSVIKPAVFFILIKIFILLLYPLTSAILYFFTCLGLLSMIFGNLLALFSSKIKRFLGYTSIGQFGFLLICLASTSFSVIGLSFIYLLFYNLFFALLLTIFYKISPNLEVLNISNFTDLNFILQNDNFLKLIVSFSLLSISGLPPLVFFMIKFSIFFNIFIEEIYFIIFIMILLNIIVTINYLKILNDIWVIDSILSEFNFFKNDVIDDEEEKSHDLKIENQIYFFIVLILILTIILILYFKDIELLLSKIFCNIFLS